MREIKFRAWINEDKKMIYSKNMWLTLHKFGGEIVITKSKHKLRYNYELMQYTGVKSANRKEIYEGDIVKRQDERIGVIKYGKYDTTDTNGINNIGFYIDWKDDPFTRIDLGFWIKQVEVIGNIYENPELLGE